MLFQPCYFVVFSHDLILISIAALQSVFPQTELGSFMALPRPDKEQQLKELTSIVTGIRLFNRDSGKGGEGVDDCEFLYFVALAYVKRTYN